MEAGSQLAQVVARVQNSNERSGYLLFLNFELDWGHFLWRKPNISYLSIHLLFTEAGSRLAQVVARADQLPGVGAGRRVFFLSSAYCIIIITIIITIVSSSSQWKQKYKTNIWR